jgi:hypothetical protein
LRIAETFLIRKEFAMKKELLESGVRRLSCGLALVVFALALALGACDIIESPEEDVIPGTSAPSADAALPDDHPDFTVPDADGKVLVRVKVPAQAPVAASRSLNATQAQRYANYFEVIFADKSTTLPVYYSDAVPSGETLNVRVPVAHSYDILFLAGYGSTSRILLGSDFLNNKDANGTAGYVADGAGYLIEAGKANIIDVSVMSVIIDPIKEYTFAWVDEDVENVAPVLKVNDELTILTDKVGPALEAASTAIEAIIAAFGDDEAEAGIRVDLLAALKELAFIVDPDPDEDEDTDDGLTYGATSAALLDAAVSALGDAETDGYIKTALDAIDALIALENSIADATDAIDGLSEEPPTGTIGAAQGLVGTAVKDIADAIAAIQLAAKTTNDAITKVNAAIKLAAAVSEELGETSGDPIITSVGTAETARDSAVESLVTGTADKESVVSKGNELIALNKKATATKTGDLSLDLPAKSGIVDSAGAIVASDLKVTITLKGYLLPLIRAEEGRVPTFRSNRFTLENSARSVRTFPAPSGYLVPGGPTLSGENVTFEYTFENVDLIDQDAYGLLAFNLTYSPFGTSEAGKAWTLRNGLDNTLIDNSGVPPDSLSNTAGGAAYVTIGQGGDILDDSISVTGY